MRNHMLWFANGFRVSVVMTLLMLAIQMSLAQSASRINQAIHDSELTRIPNSTHPLTARAADLGRVDSRLPMQRMVLVLKPSEAQETELTRLLDHQHDKNSASYHQWITPEEYGRRFGPSDEDLAQVTSWLQQKRFHIDRIARGKQWIEFSGDAGQVEQAFHTEIHHFMASGEKRIANAGDISVPQALAPVVTGILSLHNFPKRRAMRNGSIFTVTKRPANLCPISRLRGVERFISWSPGITRRSITWNPCSTRGSTDEESRSQSPDGRIFFSRTSTPFGNFSGCR